MKYPGIASFFASAALMVFGCSSSSPGDSETHWVVCKTTADCHGGQACEHERCTDPTSRDAGTSSNNPTGTCVAPDSGARRGYHSPDPGDVWLPDCKNPLKREYYRVFTQSETSAYVIPRPDGAFELVLPCNDATHPMRALVEKYSLCEGATDPTTADRINHMSPADALALTHYMHGVLIFESREGVPNASLRPFGIPSDVVDACALHPAEVSTELSVDCTAQRAAIDSGLESPTFYTTAGELAKLLNELYGVAGCVRPDSPMRMCTRCGGGGCAETGIVCTRRCTTSADCGGSPAGSECVAGACGSFDVFCPF